MPKKIMKVPIGIPVLDDTFSGIYVGHVTFLTGASGEGREVAAGTALNNYYRLDEQVLAVFAESTDHIALRAREVGYDLEKAAEIGALSTLYHAYKPGEVLSVRESLEEIIEEAHRCSANVLFIQDARPWLEVHPVSAAPERVAEFISTLEESLAGTSLRRREEGVGGDEGPVLGRHPVPPRQAGQLLHEGAHLHRTDGERPPAIRDAAEVRAAGRVREGRGSRGRPNVLGRIPDSCRTTGDAGSCGVLLPWGRSGDYGHDAVHTRPDFASRAAARTRARIRARARACTRAYARTCARARARKERLYELFVR